MHSISHKIVYGFIVPCFVLVIRPAVFLWFMIAPGACGISLRVLVNLTDTAKKKTIMANVCIVLEMSTVSRPSNWAPWRLALGVLIVIKPPLSSPVAQ